MKKCASEDVAPYVLYVFRPRLLSSSLEIQYQCIVECIHCFNWVECKKRLLIKANSLMMDCADVQFVGLKLRDIAKMQDGTPHR